MNLFVTGTDTDAGKTIVSAWICSHLRAARYWKLVQTGDDSDAATVRSFAPSTELIPEAYKLQAPLSAFDAAKKEGVTIDVGKFRVPEGKAVVIEGAGGVFVPIADGFLMIDAIKRTNSQALVVARSKLGLINHILLTVFALKSHKIPVVGIVVCGDLEKDLRETIEHFSRVRILTILPTLQCPNHASLAHLFETTPLPKEISEIFE